MPANPSGQGPTLPPGSSTQSPRWRGVRHKVTDANVHAEFWPNSTLGFSVSTQYERWAFPVIQLNPSKNVAAAIGVVFQPKRFF
jgi:hypothetical protein